MNDVIDGRSPEDLIAEGECLYAGHPFCHKMLNDLTALTLICKMKAQGFNVSLDDAEECLQRLRMTSETGIHPDDLWQEPRAPARIPVYQ